MRRIAVVAHRSPWPTRSGETVRLAGLVAACRTLGDLTLLVPGGAPGRPDGVRWVAPARAALPAALRAVARGRPPAFVPFAALTAPSALRREPPFDLVVAFQLKTWRVAAGLPARRTALELTDALSRLVRRPELPWPRRLALAGVAREEAQAALRLGTVLVSAPEEAEPLVGRGVSVLVVPNAPLVVERLPMPEERRRILFVADLGYPPNRQGLERFLREIWPTLARTFRLRLVGRGSERFGGVPGVEAAGTVEDLRPHYRASAAAVSPVRWGGGTQTKIWEALGYGRRVVATAEAPGDYPPDVRRAPWEAGAWREALAWAVAEAASPDLPTLAERFAAALAALLG